MTFKLNTVNLTVFKNISQGKPFMPKAPRNPDEIFMVKKRILDAALDILSEQGFHSLSMRKIANRTKMTAANLYNYFSNKDEIYLAIQTRGFELLVQRFQKIDQTAAAPLDKIRRMIRAYIDFGIHYPDQYEIMFTRNTPKFSDYVGTSLEPAATVEKQTALQLAQIAVTVILTMHETVTPGIAEDAMYRTTQVWTALHGVVSLLNSRVLQEVEQDTDGMVDKLAEELLLPFHRQDKP